VVACATDEFSFSAGTTCSYFKHRATSIKRYPAAAMSPEEFRRLALSMPEAQEFFRYSRSQFRVERRAFAWLEGAADSIATLLVTTDQQTLFVDLAPSAFAPAPGGDGRLGVTRISLATADERW
jgi:hypothetical protein